MFNKNMVASITAADGDLACATPIGQAPSGYVTVVVGRTTMNVGGNKIHDCYFSADGGATARALGAATLGDLLYWNGSVAGFELDATFTISFLYLN